MGKFATVADRDRIEQETTWEDRSNPKTLYQMLANARDNFGNSKAVSYQITSGPGDKSETLSWSEVHDKAVQAANLFRNLGVGEKDVVAYLLPNCTETIHALLGGAIAGIVNPINPLLDAVQIAAILRETGASVLVTLKAFPKTDVPQKAAQAAALASNIKTVVEIDLLRYLSAPKSWIVPLIRPKNPTTHRAKIIDFTQEMSKQSKNLDFDDSDGDRVAAYFHTGGTTGMPKVAQHRYSGMVYNGWLGHRLLFEEGDNVICPLPLFHVFAVYPILMSMITSGAHVVFPTPAGYRGEGVMDNFWKLVEHWDITFVITVPTAISALMQRPVNADISSLKIAFSGSAPLPIELFNRFTSATGVTIVEGYGLTEATCLVSCNPPDGNKKIGSVGIPFPYADIQIIQETPDGPAVCNTDEVGEICVANPGVNTGSTYTEADKNQGLYLESGHLRTGDLGRIDEDGYLWITGRAKDLIIRGGHNIDPAEIEEALAGHEAVAFVGAIGQPDAHAGELPCAYVELVDGAETSNAELMTFARNTIRERAAHPKYVEIIDELPKTAVGKVFKPDLRKRAIRRVYDAALEEAGLNTRVTEVIESKQRGLVAQLGPINQAEDKAISRCLGGFVRPWEWEN